MNRPIRRVAFVAMLMFALLLVVSHQARKPVATVAPLDPDAETTQLVRAPAAVGGPA